LSNRGTIMKTLFTRLILVILCLSVVTAEAKRKKKPRFKPYYLVTAPASDYQTAVNQIRDKLTNSEFKLLGEYSPLADRTIFAITNDKLLEIAAKTEFGGYGSVIRVAVTNAESGVQVSHVNSTYMSYAYQMENVAEVSAALKDLFGETTAFGSKRGETQRSLKGYQYMMMMPEFEDHDKLASFDSHQQALDTVNKNLASSSGKLTKVFEIAIPGKDEVLIGVGIGEGDGGDKFIMDTIDVEELKHSAHLPYAVLVSGNKVYSQAGKFRIALAFPDLGMGQFMDISDAPDAIVESLEKLTKK